MINKKAKTVFTPEQETEIHNIMEATGTTRKNAIRKMHKNIAKATALRETAERNTKALATAAKKLAPKVKKVKVAPAPKKTAAEAGAARAEGMRLFKLAGRPTYEQFRLVYGEKGAKLTWDQRAAMGVPAEKFQDALKMATALAAKTGQKTSPAPSPAPTVVVTTEATKGAAEGK